MIQMSIGHVPVTRSYFFALGRPASESHRVEDDASDEAALPEMVLRAEHGTLGLTEEFMTGYRRFAAKARERVPLFAEFGLVNQLGNSDYARPRKFREPLEGRLDLLRAMWPECPAAMDANGTGLWVGRANDDHTAEVNNTRSTG